MSTEWRIVGVAVFGGYPDNRNPARGWKWTFEIAHVDNKIVIEFFCLLEWLDEACSAPSGKVQFAKVGGLSDFLDLADFCVCKSEVNLGRCPAPDAFQLAKELDVTQQSGARYLLELADRIGTKGKDGTAGLVLPLSRQQIADVLGLTIETVSRQLTSLRSEGLIDLPSRREIVLRDSDGLKQRAG